MDFHRLIRNMAWKTHFYKDQGKPKATNATGPPDLNHIPSKLKPPSQTDPPAIPSPLEVFKKMVLMDMDKKYFKKPQASKLHSNLKKEEYKALNDLKKNDEIIIKKADKGGGLVIMDKSDYIKEAERQLSDANTYMKLSKDPTSDLQTLVSSVLTDAVNDGIISPETQKYLTTTNPRVPVLYLLPKIHKSLANPPGRPIVSGTGSLLQTLAVYVDQHLQPIVNKLPGCLKDTTHFLDKMTATDFSDVTFIGSVDVTSLYTSIPHDEGLCCVRQELIKNHNYGNKEIGFLMSLLELTLTKNYFRFGQQYYLQLLGCSMGSSVAPSLANIFMANLEQTLILNVPTYRAHLKLWLRYVDDVFFAWVGPETLLKEFLGYINTIHATIKFTMEYSQNSQKFLDVLVIKNGPQITTQIYKKETDVNPILLRSSYHPPKVFKGIVTGHLTRLKRITSNPTTFQTQSAALLQDYKTRGYKHHETSGSLETVMGKPNNMKPIVNSKKGLTNDCPPLLCQFGPHARLLRESMKKHWAAVASDPILKRIFPNPPGIIFKKGRPISNWVVKGDINPREPKKDSQTRFGTSKSGTFACLNCCHCSGIIKGCHIQHPTLGTKIPLKGYFTCNSSGVIYVLKCPCGLAYVGQTSRKIKLRLTEHKSVIRSFLRNPCNSKGQTKDDKFKQKETSLARHFATSKHQVSDVKWMVLEEVWGCNSDADLKKRLLAREVYWIHSLNTLQPTGLNEECVYSNAWR